MRRAEKSDSVVHVVTDADLGHTTKAGEGGTLDWHFVADSVRDFVFGITDESLWDAARTAVGDRNGDGVTDYARVDAVYRETAKNWVHAAEFAQYSIHFLSGFTGLPYPWPHMSAVEGGGIIGGGMEYPMMTLIGDYNQRSDSALYSVVVHEFGHMWVPMTVNTDERRYAWLDEGTTTFNEDNGREARFPGTHPFRAEQRSYEAKALSGTEGPMMRWSDWQYENAYEVASYPKPAAVLHALQGVLGKEVFTRAYHEFFHRWAFKHAYPWDLWKTFEDVSGEDLSWFWRSWYYESTQFGGPWVLDQAVASVERQDDGSTRITVNDNGWIPMPVRLTVTRADSSVGYANIPVDTWLSGRVQASVTVAPGAEVTRVEIDAGHWFPDVNRRNNVWTK
ncbi:MAG: M1 family aminopeptidase [Gemmatimonadota bacterium]